jgi:hypothetical protein
MEQKLRLNLKTKTEESSVFSFEPFVYFTIALCSAITFMLLMSMTLRYVPDRKEGGKG